MSDTFKHTIGILAAGLFAFAAVGGAYVLTEPDRDPQSPVHVDDSGHQPPEEPQKDPAHSDDPAEAFLGRWQAPPPANQDAFVEFTAYGLWFASDGCNRAEGTWTVSAEGDFRTNDGGVLTQIGCDNVPIPSAVWAAESAELGDGELTLIDGEGTAFELVRVRDGGITLAGRWVTEDERSTGDSFVELREDGTWTGSDGCNSAAGNWKARASEDYNGGVFDGGAAGVAEADGAALIPGVIEVELTSGMTEMSCDTIDTVNLPMRLSEADGFALGDGGKLMITDSAAPDPAEWESLTLVRAN